MFCGEVIVEVCSGETVLGGALTIGLGLDGDTAGVEGTGHCRALSGEVACVLVEGGTQPGRPELYSMLEVHADVGAPSVTSDRLTVVLESHESVVGTRGII
jgi:hypothetical protein